VSGPVSKKRLFNLTKEKIKWPDPESEERQITHPPRFQENKNIE
jgi:hypothetical protein